MIGVLAHPSDHAVLGEFFELFKTPWELYRPGKQYEVLLCTAGAGREPGSARLVLTYAGRRLPSDARDQLDIASAGGVFAYSGAMFPIYGDAVVFRGATRGVAVPTGPNGALVHQTRVGDRVVARIGYDLAAEVRALLSSGQPAANAGSPALELHIELLRALILASGTPVVEIPPVPEGYRFVACLTHDVDHPSIRKHKFDHTMWGFLYRATVGSVFDALGGRRPASHIAMNWLAAAKLPLVHLGLARDFWYEFDRYTKLERGLPSSFFVIPFKDHAGKTLEGAAPAKRASRYGASDIAEPLRRLAAAGCEIALHGLDAWIDGDRGREELHEIAALSGSQEIGARMHWLYFGPQSPAVLEKAGVTHDSTVGYNETIGYRAGTTQVYKPLGVSRLLELPLHVMDTALFYPDYLHLAPAEASRRISTIIDNAVRWGGSVTFNWHDRSIAPERLWGDVYLSLIDECRAKGAWFATAAQAVAWFRKRRSACFEDVRWEGKTLRANVHAAGTPGLPGLRLRVHEPAADGGSTCRDLELKDSVQACTAV